MIYLTDLLKWCVIKYLENEQEENFWVNHKIIKVRCADGNIRMTRIPGKMKKRIWIREGDVVLVKPWDFQSDQKADVIWRYTRTESNWLERKGYLTM